MVYRTVICVLLAVVGVALGCSEAADDPTPPVQEVLAPEVETPKVVPETPRPPETPRVDYTPHPPAVDSKDKGGAEDVVAASSSEQVAASGVTASLPQYVSGPPTLEEHILTSDVVARVTLRSVEPTARWDGSDYLPYITITFDVLEALQGSPRQTAVVDLLAGELCCHKNEADALAVGRRWIAERDTSLDGNEALVFLWDVSRSEYSLAEGRPASIGYVFAGDGFATWNEDRYSIFSDLNKAWFPATSAGGGQPFHIDDPSTGRTMTLADIKALVTTTNAEVDPSIEGHAECVLAKYQEQRGGHPKPPEFLGEENIAIASGQDANSVIHSYRTGARIGRTYPKYVVDGPDGQSFSGETVDNDTDPENEYWREFKQVRPLPGGAYVFHHGIQFQEFFPCGYFPLSRVKYTVTATPPSGTLHELFFDPVDVGDTLAADSTNGVIKPAAFTDANGASATLSSISYDSDTVKLEVTPDDVLDDHIVDIIELDGTVSLSLDVADATVDAANNTLSWSVSSQPWEDGDKLMVRIREAR